LNELNRLIGRGFQDDLTKPDSQEAFRLSEYVANIQEDTLNFSKNDVATKKAASVVNTAHTTRDYFNFHFIC
jgi:hypothetical protein